MTIHWLIVVCVCTVFGDEPRVPATPNVPAAETPAASQDPAEDERFMKRLETVDAAMGRVVDLRAGFEQSRRTILLKKPLLSKGTVTTKGDRVRWDTATPRASSLLIGDGSIRMYYPEDNLLEIYPVGSGFKDLAGAPLPRLAKLREKFTISRLSPSDLGASNEDEHLLAVQLIPKEDDLRKHIASVKVLIDESRPVARKVVMTDPEDEQTEITFTNVELNVGVTDDALKLDTPADVRVSHPLGENKEPTDNPAHDASPDAPHKHTQEPSR